MECQGIIIDQVLLPDVFKFSIKGFDLVFHLKSPRSIFQPLYPKLGGVVDINGFYFGENSVDVLNLKVIRTYIQDDFVKKIGVFCL
jgi:hypothetical protein